MDPTKTNKLEVKIQDCKISPKVQEKLIKFGILTIQDLINLNYKEVKAIKGLGTLGYAEIILFLKKEKLNLKTVPKVIDPFSGVKKNLIKKLLKPDQPINWPRELKVANTLIQKKPDIQFWENFNLPFKLNSLSFLLTDRGKEFLFKAKVEKHDLPLFQPTQTELSSEKIGEDVICHKPKSIKDFLNGR